jgi:hypothetical protein
MPIYLRRGIFPEKNNMARDAGKLIDFLSQIVHGSTVRFEGEPCSG